MNRQVHPCRCPHCCQPLPSSSLICPGCGKSTVPENALLLARAAGEKLAHEWAESPYFRGAKQNAYTLRARKLGFSSAADSPLSEAIVGFLRQLAQVCTIDEWPFLLHQAVSVELASSSPELVAAVDALRRQHEASLITECRRGSCPPARG